jgi:hypothetical protein
LKRIKIDEAAGKTLKKFYIEDNKACCLFTDDTFFVVQAISGWDPCDHEIEEKDSFCMEDLRFLVKAGIMTEEESEAKWDEDRQNRLKLQRDFERREFERLKAKLGY